MKTKRSLLCVLLTVVIGMVATAGCKNTARGLKQDTNNAAQKVEQATD